jgi:hypothetical protein
LRAEPALSVHAGHFGCRIAGTQIVSVDQGTHGAITAFTTASDALYWLTSSAANGTANEIRATPLSGGTPTSVPAVPGAMTTPVYNDYNGFGLSVLQGVGDTL